MKILIIDDESIIRRSLVRAAQSKGHEAFDADGGEAGIEQWVKLKPDIVFLDVLMPDLTGPQVLKEIGENKAKVILISAYTGEYDLEKARNLGADLYIPKPFNNIFEVITKAEELYASK